MLRTVSIIKNRIDTNPLRDMSKGGARGRRTAAAVLHPPNWDTMSLDGLCSPLNRPRATPKSTIEAVMHSVRERGLAALKEPVNIERLSRCDAAAKTEINRRIARMVAAKEIAA